MTKKTLDPGDLKALLRQGDPARALDADAAERLRRTIRAAARESASVSPAARPGWDLRVVLATAVMTACALLLVVGLERRGPAPLAVPDAEAPAPRRVQIDFATPGGTRIVWTLIREEPGARRGR
jgi:hypothetical protein